MRRTFLFIIAIVFLFSCTKDYINSSGSNSSGKGLIELAVKIPGHTERAPQGKTHSPEVPMAGTSAESTIRTLHIFAFNTTTGAKEVHEVLKIGADGLTATDEINGGANHPMWSGATQKLRVTITPGSKSLYIVSNWHTSESAEDGCPSLRAIDDSTTLRSIVRSHSAILGLPLVDASASQHPVMFGLKSITLTGSEQNLDIELERVIARVDMYPAISTLLKNAGVEVKIEGIKFRNIAGASFLVPHNDGGTPALPVSPVAASSTLWAESSFGGTPMTNNITITNPATAGEDEKFGTFYVPEYIAADETKATEMVIKATYNGSIHYYAVKLHNGLSDLSKRYWVERNHWYRYNITITGRGSTNETMPDYDNVEIGLRNTDWEGGESTTPDVGFELPHGDITVMHFKGISRFILSTSKDYGVGSDVNWLSARRVKEGVGINERTYLEIMTRTNTTSSERTGHITVMLPNGLTQTLTVKQLTEAGSTWTNPTDGTTWYRANIGAARMEDPGFFYQWGINKSYSPYTPVAGVAPSLTEPLVSYGAVNWNEIPQIFPQSIPVTSWNTTASTDASWLPANDPCPNGYVVPAGAQLHALIGNSATSITTSDWSVLNGQDGHWLKGEASVGLANQGIFLPKSNIRWTDGVLTEGEGTYLGATNNLRMWGTDIAYRVGIPWPFGFSLRCVKAANVRYDGNGADGGSMSDRKFYAAAETVTIQTNAYTKAGYSFGGWEVLKPDGSVLHASIAAGGTFSYPASTEYVTVKAKWVGEIKVEPMPVVLQYYNNYETSEYTVTSTSNWSIDTPVGAWYSISPSSGTPGSKFKVTSTQQNSTSELRSATIKIRNNDGADQDLVINQKPFVAPPSSGGQSQGWGFFRNPLVATSYTDGLENTIALMKNPYSADNKFTWDGTKYRRNAGVGDSQRIAAQFCIDANAVSDDGGATYYTTEAHMRAQDAWYLPSMNQLMQYLALYPGVTPAFEDKVYWTSTETSYDIAALADFQGVAWPYPQGMMFGHVITSAIGIYNPSKSWTNTVRCINDKPGFVQNMRIEVLGGNSIRITNKPDNSLYNKHPNDGVSAYFQVANFDETGTFSGYISRGWGCAAGNGWRVPTHNELMLIASVAPQLTNTPDFVVHSTSESMYMSRTTRSVGDATVYYWGIFFASARTVHSVSAQKPSYYVRWRCVKDL